MIVTDEGGGYGPRPFKGFTMPIYEYKCTQCNATIETFVWLANGTLDTKVCPGCHGKMTKLVSRVNVRPDYADLSHFGTEQFADAQRKKCGLAGD